MCAAAVIIPLLADPSTFPAVGILFRRRWHAVRISPTSSPIRPLFCGSPKTQFLEKKFLELIDYDVSISASLYASYYFQASSPQAPVLIQPPRHHLHALLSSARPTSARDHHLRLSLPAAYSLLAQLRTLFQHVDREFTLKPMDAATAANLEARGTAYRNKFAAEYGVPNRKHQSDNIINRGAPGSQQSSSFLQKLFDN